MNKIYIIIFLLKLIYIGETFLLYDSYDDEEEPENAERIIVYATQQNLRLLNGCRTWFFDGTFETAPNIFVQLFAILGSATQVSEHAPEQEVALPLAYALLQSKSEQAYTKVLQVIVTEGHKLGLTMQPQYVLTDFELAIINASKNLIQATVKGCFFHLKQSLYRRIQNEGLVTKYNDPNDRSIKKVYK